MKKKPTLENILLLNSAGEYSENKNTTKLLRSPAELIDLIDIEKSIKNLVKDDSQLFSIANKKDNKKSTTLTSLGRSIISITLKQIPSTIPVFKDHETNPLIALAFKHLNLPDLFVLNLNSILTSNSLPIDDADYVARQLNSAVADLRKDAKSKESVKKLRAINRRAAKNTRSLTHYVDKLFDLAHARLTVIRVDLGYKPEIQRESEVIERIAPPSLQEVINHREQFFAHMRSNKLFEHMVGKAWSLEYGSKKDYHYHFLFLFNGSKVRQDIIYAKRIIECWINDITDKRGTGFNSNASKDAFKDYCGIGSIDHSDASKRWNLREIVIPYITKMDYFVRIKTDDDEQSGKSKNRFFGKSEMPKLSPCKLGRKRKAEAS